MPIYQNAVGYHFFFPEISYFLSLARLLLLYSMKSLSSFNSRSKEWPNRFASLWQVSTSDIKKIKCNYSNSASYLPCQSNG